MSNWPKHIDACLNCTGESNLYAHGACGYCRRCNEVLSRIKVIKAWDRSKPATLKWIGSDSMICTRYTDEEFEIVRNQCLNQLRQRLRRFRLQAESRRHEIQVDGLALEEKFKRILKLARPDARQPMNANYFNDQFRSKCQTRTICVI